MKVNLGIVVASHLNDAMIEVNFNTELATKRMKFVKALTFHNPNLELGVTDDYLNWLWAELDKGNWGGEYDKETNYVSKVNNNNIREYYLEAFPSDELGTEINPKATFEGLEKVLNNYEDVYEYIGVGDSIVRERVFDKLAEILGVEYDVIYSQWILAA
jgi:hypothetical protein